MNARLTSIGFYLTCIIFFGFQAKPLIHTNNTLTPSTMGYTTKPVDGRLNFTLEQDTENKNIKHTRKHTAEKLVKE